MDRQQIIQEKDRIVSSLFEGAFDSAQALRQKALIMFMNKDLHHGELGGEIALVSRKAIEKLSIKEIEQRLVNFYLEAAKLNTESDKKIFSFDRGHARNLGYATDKNPSVKEMTKYVKGKIERWKDSPSSGAVDYDGAARDILDTLQREIIRKEIVQGVRHVFPESVEQRVLMNHGLDIIDLLENIESDSMWKDELDVSVEWNRIPLEPQYFKGKRQYTPPQNLSEWRDMHRWWTKEFNTKAREFVVGDNVYLYGDLLTENIVANDAYYQYAGFGQRGVVPPPIVQLLDDKLVEVLKDLNKKFTNEIFFDMANKAGIDLNDLNFFEKLGEGSREKLKELARERMIEFIEANSSASDKLIPVIYPELAIPGMVNESPNTKIYSYLEGPVEERELFKNRIDIKDVLEGEVTLTNPVVDERLRLERIIKNDIQTPLLKEGLLKRYLDYDEFIEGLPADRAEQLLDYTNKDVAFNLDLFKDQFDLQKPYYPGELESINSILFDWEEPSPIEDAVLADIEDWDLDSEGNPIDPRKKPEGMSKFKQELSAQYNYLLTSDTPTSVETFNIDDYKPFTLEVTDPAGLHAGPTAKLINDLQGQGLKPIVMENGVLKEVGMTGILKRGVPLGGTLELFVPKDLISIDMGDGSSGYKVQLSKPNQTQRVSSETGLSTHSDRIRKVAQDYHKIMGYSDPEFKPAMVFNDEVGAIAADIFEQLPMFDDNAIPYYKKFIQETNMQYQTLLDAGMKFEVVDGDPYTPNRAGHQQMIADMENGVLKVLATESGFGDEATSKLNPMLAESMFTDVNGRVMLENDVFRAVHDTFGHGMRGNTFGPIGEYNAWLAHKEMYSPDARRVMTTETLGQNTFTNYGPHMRDAEGKLLSKADAGYIKPADRPFASQKVALMPEEIINVAGTVVEDASELVDTRSLNKVVELASTQPEVADGIMKSAKKVVGKAFNTAAGVLDPGDVAITAGISRLLPRLGLAAISPAALAAYVGYELSVLAIDAAQSFDKARQKQGIELLDYDNTNPNINWKELGKDTWNEFGEISDTWSLSWKISEPIIDYAFGEYAKLQENR